MPARPPLFCALLALVGALAAPCAANAVILAGDGQWAAFDVAYDLSGNLGWIDLSDASALTFTFSVAPGELATLTVVDGGFAGDRFDVTNQGALIGTTSAAVNSYPANAYLDFDSALADSNHSRGVYSLGAGSYRVGGGLASSALDDAGGALNTTVGGIRLSVSPVPEGGTAASLLAGLGLLASLLHRRSVR